MPPELPLSAGMSPRHEARMLLPLLKLPRASIQTVRALIDVSATEERELRRDEAHAESIIRFRRECLKAFDKLIAPKQPQKITTGGRLSAEMKTWIRDAVLRGVHPREIMRVSGTTYKTVLGYREQAGIKVDLNVLRRKLSPEKITRATRLLESGLTWPQAARELNVSVNTLVRHISFRRRTGRWHKGVAHAEATRARQ